VIKALKGVAGEAQHVVHGVVVEQPIPVPRAPAASASRYNTCPTTPDSQKS
jgi:hypothetical protein